MNLDFIFIVITLVCLFAATVAKAVCTRLLRRIENQVSAGNQAKSKVLGKLKMAQAQNSVIKKNQASMLEKKAKLQKKIEKANQTLAQMAEKDNYREQLNANMRGKLIRPTRAAPGTSQ